MATSLGQASRLQRTLAKRRGTATAIFMSLFVLWGGYQTVGLRLGIALNGVVVRGR